MIVECEPILQCGWAIGIQVERGIQNFRTIKNSPCLKDSADFAEDSDRLLDVFQKPTDECPIKRVVRVGQVKSISDLKPYFTGRRMNLDGLERDGFAFRKRRYLGCEDVGNAPTGFLFERLPRSRLPKDWFVWKNPRGCKCSILGIGPVYKACPALARNSRADSRELLL